MTTDEKDVVSAVGLALAEKVGKDRYETWFGSHARLSYDGAALLVRVPNRFFQDWLRTHFRRDLEAACKQVIPGECPVNFEVAESPTQPEEPAPTISTQAAPTVLAFPKPHAAPAVQMERRRWSTLGAFVVGRSNRLAHATATSITERLGEVSPAVFVGPTGVGKTHLLEGVWTATRQSRQALYLTAEQFTTQFLEALRGAGLPSFRRKVRSADVLLIDDIQFFAGKRATLVELLHTVDFLAREGKQLVLTADRAFDELSGLGGELLSRLQGGMICRIETPDDEVRLGIVRQHAAQCRLQTCDDTLRYVAEQFTSHARELQGAVNRLLAESRARGARVTQDVAMESLSDLVRHTARPVRLADIEKAVCDVFSLEPQSLQSDSKSQAVSRPRMLAMFLARKLTRAAFSEIGQHFGGRKHTTVISAQKKMDALIEKHANIRVSNRECPIEEALRRVEAALKTG